MSDTTSFPSLACVVLAAGQGTRMRSDLPKVLHPVAHSPMIRHVLTACEQACAQKIVVVVASGMAAVEAAVAPHGCVVQAKPQGTGDAVKAAREALRGFEGDVAVLFGDTPLVTAQTLQRLQARRRETGAAIIVAGFTPDDPFGYGRLALDGQGNLLQIVEEKDATREQRATTLCNGGAMLFEAARLWPLLDRIGCANAKGEYYLTDCVALARQDGAACAVVEISAEEVLGVNTRVDLAQAEALMQARLRRKAMLDGVSMQAPETVFLAFDTVLGRDVSLGPHVVFGPGVVVEDGVEIRAFCHLEGAKVARGASIGPYARLRSGAVIGASAHIGNFVEIKKAEIGVGAKINHLSYIGDAFVGAGTNIGAGTITCNYDGFSKFRTEIGAGVFVGSDTSLVAPVSVGDGAIIGAGSVITHDVPADAIAIARGKQVNLQNRAARFRASRKGHR
ncbi:MAG: bifunctional UDP-N-acetylglucosamine diphosphorylase/glucosamine-1-phosphate N-acetyltransferase GlmU [Bdellovibrionales bacterium]